MKKSPKQSMSPAGYFGTGVGVGLLIGIFIGFLAYGILSEDDAHEEPARGFDTSLQDLSAQPSDSDRLDPAPANLWDDEPEESAADTRDASQADTEEDDRSDSRPSPQQASEATSPERSGGIRDIDNWPDPADNGAEEDAAEEDQWPNPGGGRLANDPAIPFSPPEE